MNELSQRLVEWAQNNEMIDQYYTKHGEDCMKAAQENELLRDENGRLRDALFNLANSWTKYSRASNGDGETSIAIMAAHYAALSALAGKEQP